LLYVILLGLLPCNRLGTRPLDYIKEGWVPSRKAQSLRGTTPSAGRNTTLNRTYGSYFGYPNLYKSCVLCPRAYLRVPDHGDPHLLPCCGYLPWRSSGLNTDSWRPPWGHRHDHQANLKDFFKINLPEAAALSNSAESLHMRDQDEVDFKASADLLLRINSLVLAALSSRQNYSAKQIRSQLHIKIKATRDFARKPKLPLRFLFQLHGP
jgi:hypothetical protein